MLKGWLVYNKEDLSKNTFFINRLIEEGRKVGFCIELIVREETS